MYFGKIPRRVLANLMLGAAFTFTTTGCLTFSSSSDVNGLTASFNAAVSTLSTSSTVVATGDTMKVTLGIKDDAGQLLYKSGYNVRFFLKGDAVGTFSQIVDKYDGTFESTFTAGNTPGTAVFNAVVDNVLVGTALPRIQVVIDPSSMIIDSSKSTISISPATVINDGHSPANVTVTLKNSAGIPIPSKSVKLSTDRQADQFDGFNPVSTDANGQAVFRIHSTAIGVATVTAVADTVILPNPGNILFLSTTPTSDFQARAYDSSNAGNNFDLTKHIWKDLASTSNANNGTLYNFLFSSISGWGGSGSVANPYALLFSPTAGNYGLFGMNLNSSNDFSFETWISPFSYTDPGTVIFSNGNSTNQGMALRQSSDGLGKLQLLLGNRSYADEILADSPAAYWRLDEASNSSFASDTSGRQKMGVYVGVPSSLISGGVLQNDSTNQSLTLNGSTTYVILPDNLPGTRTAFTYEAWFKTTTPGPIIISADASFPNTPTKAIPTLYIDSNGHLRGRLWTKFEAYNGLEAMNSSRVVTDNQWHHAAIVADGVIQYLYVDGQLRAQKIEDIKNLPVSKITLGYGYNWYWPQMESSWSSWLYFKGQIDEVAYYNSALSKERIVEHVNARSHAVCVSNTALTNRNEWSMVTGVFKKADLSLKLYINAVPECTIHVTGATYAGSAAPLSIGGGMDTHLSPIQGTHWSGAMSEFRTYNKPLTNSNVTEHFNATYYRYR